jgi:chromosome segregation ATPase
VVPFSKIKIKMEDNNHHLASWNNRKLIIFLLNSLFLKVFCFKENNHNQHQQKDKKNQEESRDLRGKTLKALLPCSSTGLAKKLKYLSLYSSISMPFGALQLQNLLEKIREIEHEKTQAIEKSQIFEENLFSKAQEIASLKSMIKESALENARHLSNIQLKAIMIQELADRVQEKEDLIYNLDLNIASLKRENKSKDLRIAELERTEVDLKSKISDLLQKAETEKDQNQLKIQNNNQMSSESNSIEKLVELCRVREEQLERAICQLNHVSERALEAESNNQILTQRHNELLNLYKELEEKQNSKQHALTLALEDKAELLHRLGYFH